MVTSDLLWVEEGFFCGIRRGRLSLTVTAAKLVSTLLVAGYGLY
jgi:hypothetical protein